MYSRCNPLGYNHWMPAAVSQQLPTAHPSLANEISALSQDIMNKNLTIKQALIRVQARIGKIADPKVAAGLRGAAAILQEAANRPDQELLRQYARDLLQLTASFLATVKKKN